MGSEMKCQHILKILVWIWAQLIYMFVELFVARKSTSLMKIVGVWDSKCQGHKASYHWVSDMPWTPEQGLGQSLRGKHVWSKKHVRNEIREIILEILLHDTHIHWENKVLSDLHESYDFSQHFKRIYIYESGVHVLGLERVQLQICHRSGH